MAADSSGAERPKPPRGRPFQAGQSGNPGGKSAEREAQRIELLNILSRNAKEAGQLLMESARGGNILALKTWIAYVLGEPKQAIEVSGKDGAPLTFDPSRLSDDELRAATQAMEAALVIRRRADAAAVSSGNGKAMAGAVVPEG